MISPNPAVEIREEQQAENAVPPPKCVLLVRYGLVPQVARFGVSESLYDSASDKFVHGAEVVVDSDRGPEIGRVLEVVRLQTSSDDNPLTGDVIRMATSEDLGQHAVSRRECDLSFMEWQERIDGWKLQLQLIDLEVTLDGKHTVLYVLNGQDAETTRLALLAAAAGLGIIHVQPVGAEGMVQKSDGGGGCGSGGGGCGSGGCGH